MVNRKIDSSNNGTDTEGHGIRIRPDDAGRTVEDAETEGHASKFRPDDKGGLDDADTEGHATKGRP